MDPDLSRLDVFLDERGDDGFAFYDDATNSNLYYVTGFTAPDPFLAVYTPETTAILASSLEYGRAESESRADVVKRFSDYDFHDKRADHGNRDATAMMHEEFFDDLGCESLAVDDDFPISVADALRDRGVSVEADEDGVISDIRATKTDEEIEYVHRAQKANEAAMERAEQLIRGADIVDGVLHHEGAVLTSEFVKQEIEIELLRYDCSLDETIVACGEDAADGHERGSGPLEAGELIVVDIFPRDKEARYHADMTRTFVNGEVSETQQEWYDVTEMAFEAALDVVEAGVTGEEVNQAVVDVFEDHGHPTIFSDTSTETGFIHSTGHGVGLDVHEKPSVSHGGEELEPGHVITIEPGLYDPAVGGVRIEDIIVVTEAGYDNFTDYPISLTE